MWRDWQRKARFQMSRLPYTSELYFCSSFFHAHFSSFLKNHFSSFFGPKESNLQRYNFSLIPATNNSAGGAFYHKKTLIFGIFLPVSAHFSLNLAIISMNIVHISKIFLIFAPKYAHNRINQGYDF